MKERIEEWTVGELAPAHVAANGYRLYRRAEAERLQEILILGRADSMTLQPERRPNQPFRL